MAQVSSSVKKMHFVEIVLILSVVMATIVRYAFGFQSFFFLEIFCILLALLYFPFGFYFIGKPTDNYSNTISIVLGFIYALGVMTILVSEVNIDSYRYPLIADFFILAAVVGYLLYTLRSSKFPRVYINVQLIRVAFIVFVGLFILIAK
jgi:drug/metabolite transporter (DMT)-like permease